MKQYLIFAGIILIVLYAVFHVAPLKSFVTGE